MPPRKKPKETEHMQRGGGSLAPICRTHGVRATVIAPTGSTTVKLGNVLAQLQRQRSAEGGRLCRSCTDILIGEAAAMQKRGLRPDGTPMG